MKITLHYSVEELTALILQDVKNTCCKESDNGTVEFRWDKLLNPTTGNYESRLIGCDVTCIVGESTVGPGPIPHPPIPIEPQLPPTMGVVSPDWFKPIPPIEILSLKNTAAIKLASEDPIQNAKDGDTIASIQSPPKDEPATRYVKAGDHEDASG